MMSIFQSTGPRAIRGRGLQVRFGLSLVAFGFSDAIFHTVRRDRRSMRLGKTMAFAYRHIETLAGRCARRLFQVDIPAFWDRNSLSPEYIKRSHIRWPIRFLKVIMQACFSSSYHRQYDTAPRRAPASSIYFRPCAYADAKMYPGR